MFSVKCLKSLGMTAVVPPDNILFEDGAGKMVREKLLETTICIPSFACLTRIFYANGVKANVLFWDGKPGSKYPWIKEVWAYDYRTNIHHCRDKACLVSTAL